MSSKSFGNNTFSGEKPIPDHPTRSRDGVHEPPFISENGCSYCTKQGFQGQKSHKPHRIQGNAPDVLVDFHMTSCLSNLSKKQAPDKTGNNKSPPGLSEADFARGDIVTSEEISMPEARPCLPFFIVGVAGCVTRGPVTAATHRGSGWTPQGGYGEANQPFPRNFIYPP